MTQSAQPKQPESELSALARSIVSDQRRIGAMQNVTPAALATEVAGTLLAYDRDIAGYLARFEHAVMSNFAAAFQAIGELQEVGGGAQSDDSGTQFDAADALKFVDFITGAKVLIQATKDSPGTSEEVRVQMDRMIVVADELLTIVDDGTLEDDDEDGEAEGGAEPDAVTSGAPL